MYPTKEMIAYEAELYRLFPKKDGHQEDCSSESGVYQSSFSFFSSNNLSSSSAVDSGNADLFPQASPYRNFNQQGLSDSICEFSPLFNSTEHGLLSPGVSSRFSPSPEEILSTRDSSSDDLFSSSSFGLHHRSHSRYSNTPSYDYDSRQIVSEEIPRQNICNNLFFQPNRLNISNTVGSFGQRVKSSFNSSQPSRNTFSDDFLAENVNRSIGLQKTFHGKTHIHPSMVTYTPNFQASASNSQFEPISLDVPSTMHFLPVAMNIPTGAANISSNFFPNPQVSPFLSTPMNLSSHSSPESRTMTPKVNTSPTVFKVSPSSAKSSSSSTSDDFIIKDKICSFCRKNGENPRVYMTHVVKKRINGKQIVTCPILRSYVCSVCNVSGDNAHTITYCPLLKSAGISVRPTTITLKNTKMKSDGKPRFSQSSS